MWDKRKSKRVHFEHEYRATLLGLDGTWRRDCILIDVSDTGARLRMHGSTDVLKARQFFLLLSTVGLRRCKLIRLDGSEIGVQFVTNRNIRPG
ncbi:PilZ domain-containing protein [Bradyrhizobium sp. U531]